MNRRRKGEKAMCVGHVRLRYLVAGTNWGTEVVRCIFPSGPGVHRHMRGFPSLTAMSSNHWPSNESLPISPDLSTQKNIPERRGPQSLTHVCFFCSRNLPTIPECHITELTRRQTNIIAFHTRLRSQSVGNRVPLGALRPSKADRDVG